VRGPGYWTGVFLGGCRSRYDRVSGNERSGDCHRSLFLQASGDIGIPSRCRSGRRASERESQSDIDRPSSVVLFRDFCSCNSVRSYLVIDKELTQFLRWGSCSASPFSRPLADPATIKEARTTDRILCLSEEASD